MKGNHVEGTMYAYGISLPLQNDVIIDAMVYQITSLTIAYSTVYSGADQRKHQSSAPVALVRRIHRLPVNSLHKGPVTRTMFPLDDVIMINELSIVWIIGINSLRPSDAYMRQ